jgi:hypothetical protein
VFCAFNLVDVDAWQQMVLHEHLVNRNMMKDLLVDFEELRHNSEKK